MEGRPRAHSTFHTRPQARSNKLLQGLSQFKGIIRLSGRKARDDRDAERFPYPSQMDTMHPNTTTGPFMSQPLLGLERGMKSGNNDGEFSKLSGSSERFPSRDENTLQRKPSIDQDFPLRTRPRSSRSSKKSDPPLPDPLQLPNHSVRPIQSPQRGDNITITGKANGGLPPVMVPMNSLHSPSGKEPTTATNLPPKAQPENKRPIGRRRPSTANSVLTTSSNAATVKASGPLVKLKRSFSQLRLNSSPKSDVTSQNTERQLPLLPSPKSTNMLTRPTSPPITSLSPVPVPKSPTSTIAPTARGPPTRAATTSTPITAPTTATTLHPQMYHPNMTASGALAPMSFPKHLPPHPGNIQRRTPAQPPKLSLPPVNPRISSTISPTLMTDTGPARFSPTVISRPMPLPLVNLPTLTPRSDSLKMVSSLRGAPGTSTSGSRVTGGLGLKDTGKQKANSQKDEERRVGKQQLKSMPALPIQGAGRGVKGHEEIDDMEEDDESADEEDEFEEGESSRLESSKPGSFVPDMSADSFRPNFASSMSNANSAGLNHVPPSTLGTVTAFQRAKKGEWDGASSSGSSYHSAFSGIQPSHPLSAPEFSGLGIGSVPMLKEPTPPRAYLSRHTETSSASSLSKIQSAGPSSTQTHSHSTQISSHRTARLPEVDTSSLGISFLPALSPESPTAAAITVDAKGKGKARDSGSPPVNGPLTSSAAIVTGGTTRADYNHDPSKTPTAVTASGMSFSAMKNGVQSGSEDILGAGIGSVSRVLNGAGSTQMRSHAYGQASSMTSATQSPTGTIRQLPLGNNGVDYFTAKGFSLGTDVVAGDNMAGATTSPQPASVYDRHSNPWYPPLHSATIASTSYTSPHLRHSVAFSPLPTLQTPQTARPGAEGSLGDMPNLRRSSTLMAGPGPVGIVGGGYRRDVRGVSGGNAVGEGQVFMMPKMYKRASQSLVDLHTIEAKEKRRLMEEEARAEEDMELVKLREREKEREKSGLEDKEGIVKETIVVKEREKGKSSYDRIEEDDSDEDDDDEEAAEKRDQVAPAVPPKVAMAHSLITSATTTANVHDDTPPAFSLASKSATTSAATKKQNRLSTASHYLRRRRSMPMYDESSEPPPYPSFAPHPPSQYRVMPREDEGRERLPPYGNPIYLKAIMPRKMEFSSPGVQARDRKWRRVMCVLEGTVLRVYKCPPGHAGVGVLGEWWEKQVGAGDVSLQPSHTGAVSNIQIETRESRRLAEERRDLERQIQRIMKAEGGSDDGEDGEADVVFVPTPTILVREGALARSRTGSSVSLQQTPTMSMSGSSKSKFAQFLKPGVRHHTRSKSEHASMERNAPNQSPRPSLNIPSGSGTTTPRSAGGARSPSPFATGGSTRAQTPMSNSSFNINAMNSSMTGGETPTSSRFTTGRGHLQQQERQRQRQFLYSNREIGFMPEPEPGDLIRMYTLQHAESGIGNDYVKRKNVIRLRLEGEQFLLQARDVTGVVEWIEALQAATNIALDLDERPMPRGPLFPRRRRRRRPQIGISHDPSAGASGQADTTTVVTPPFTVATV